MTFGRLLPVLLACLAPFAGAGQAAQPSPSTDTPVALAIDHMLTAQREDGLFAYDFDFVRNGATGENNIVRQAGATFALGEYYADSRDPDLREPLRRALTALSLLSIEYGRGRLVSRNGKLNGVKGGATALTLLAELYYYRTSGDGRFEQARDGWLHGLLSLHQPGKGFRRGPLSEKESHYYNGEIWLALAFHARTFADPDVAAVLPQVDDYMMAAYGAAPHIGFFHWGATAAAKRYATTRDPRFAEFATAQARHYIDEMRPQVKPYANTCYALEGLIPALTLVPPDDELQPRLRARIEAEMTKIRGFQILPGQTGLDLGEGITLTSPALNRFAGAFVAGRKRPSTRIDFTQHCVSAFLRYNRLP